MRYVVRPEWESPVLLEMRAFFFESQLAGYAGTPQKQKWDLLPGSKVIRYRRDAWSMVDTYVVTDMGPASSGRMFMYWHDKPVWTMEYGGWYEKEAISCLKAALRSVYDKQEFHGGRGPERFPASGFFNGLFYANKVGNPNYPGLRELCYAAGIEEIRTEDGRLCGIHTYSGNLMAEPDIIAELVTRQL